MRMDTLRNTTCYVDKLLHDWAPRRTVDEVAVYIVYAVTAQRFIYSPNADASSVSTQNVNGPYDVASSVGHMRK